jgi:alkylhydroperoxidase family enzyme
MQARMSNIAMIVPDAALALTEAVTRISDSSDPVPDAIWNEAAEYYHEKGLAALLIAIGAINVWNRFNVSTRQVSGWRPEVATKGNQKNGTW